MLRAGLDLAALNGQLFITGYSQGGYTAVAARRELEASHGDEFEFPASAPMAGPYDLSGVMADTFTDGSEHPSPYYLAYTLIAYDAIYGLFDDPSSFLVAPYDTILPPLFDGTHSAAEINAALTDVPGEILQPGLVEAFENEADHPMRLQENDVYDWLPPAPVWLYHCAQVELVDPFPLGDHNSCAGLGLLLAKAWVGGMVQVND